jgi:hypothetical protein
MNANAHPHRHAQAGDNYAIQFARYVLLHKLIDERAFETILTDARGDANYGL